MEKTRRERSANFSQEETNLLVSLLQGKKHIIENKKSDAITWQEKEKTWKDIEKAFNSAAGSVFRDHRQLKLKYEAVKRETRKKSAIVRAERYKTGGGASTAPLLTTVEDKVKGMILLSVEGNESQFDSDVVLPSTSTSNSVITWLPVVSTGSDDEQNDPAPTALMITDDNTKNNAIVVEEQQPPKKKVCAESQKETRLQSESDNVSQSECQWKEWTPMALKRKKHPVLSKSKEKRPFDKLTEEKLEIAKIQKKIVTEELEQKIIERKFLEKDIEHKNIKQNIERKLLEKDLEHKDIIHELEKRHLLLKIVLLEKEVKKNA